MQTNTSLGGARPAAPAFHPSPASVWRLSLPALCLLACAGFGALPAGAAPAPDDNEASQTVKMPTFDVSTSQDKGYLASNSVSATRVDTPIADLPFSITAITSQFIQDTGALDLYDIVSYASGVRSASTAFTGGSNVFAIRGFNQTPEHDGFFESAQGNNFVDPVNIERVEVVKGPASLLYGTIAPGGTINYITKRPTDTAFVDTSFTFGSYNFARGTVDLSQPIIEHTLLFRLNLAWQNDFQYVLPSRGRTTAFDPTLTWKATKNLTIKSSFQRYDKRGLPNVAMIPQIEISTPQSIVNALNGSLGYPGASALLVNKTSVDFPLGYNDSSDPGSLSLVGSNGWPRRENYQSSHDWYRTAISAFNTEADLTLGEHWIARANFDYNANTTKQLVTGISTFDSAPPGSLAYNAATGQWGVSPAWNALTAAQQTAAGLAYAQQIMNYPGSIYYSQQPLIDPRRERYAEVYGHDDSVQAEASGSYHFPWGNLKPLAGLFYDANYTTNQQWQDAGTAASPYFHAWDANPNSPTYYEDFTTNFSPTALTAHTSNNLGFTTDKAVYGLLNASFFDDRVYLIGGARYNETHSKVTNYLSAAGSSSGLFHYTTPEVGVGFKVTRDLMLYASYSTSYSPPTTPVLTSLATVAGIPTSVPSGTAAPTTGVGYEAGLKTNFLSGRISSTLSVYQIDEKNLVQTVQQIVSGSTVSETFQGTKIRSKGVEYEITYSPLDNLQIFGSVTEDDVRYIQEPIGFAYYLGSHPWNTGKTMANIWARYSFLPIKGLWLGTGFQYTGRSSLVSNNINEFTPAFIVWNAAAGYDWTWQHRKLSVIVHWNNINDSGDYITAYERGLPSRVFATIDLHF